MIDIASGEVTEGQPTPKQARPIQCIASWVRYPGAGLYSEIPIVGYRR